MVDDAELAAAIDPWLAHMRWRPDFARWRQVRIEQECHQDEALGLLRAGLVLAGHTLATQTDRLEQLALLDLGCGMGGFAVAAALAGAQVTALDYHPAYCRITMLRAARYGLALPVAAAAGEHVPLPDMCCDAVTCWDVLEHVQDPEALLRELSRVLRPGGVLLITAINRFAFRDPHYHLPLINYLPRPAGELAISLLGRRKGGAFRDRQRLSAMHYFTMPQLCRLAARHGLALYDLDEQRVAAGQVGARRRWRRLAARTGMALPLYRLYRAAYQGTWRLAMVKHDGERHAGAAYARH